MRAIHTACLLALALAGCNDQPRSDPPPGAGEACVGSFLMGNVVPSAGACTSCGDGDADLSIDGSRNSFGFAYQTGGTYTLRATAPPGVSFPAGNFAGALMRIPVAYSPGTVWTISTHLGGVLQESRTPANADGGDPASPTGEDDYYGLIASLEFDGVEVSLTGGSSDLLNVSANPVRFYEFCGQR